MCEIKHVLNFDLDIFFSISTYSVIATESSIRIASILHPNLISVVIDSMKNLFAGILNYFFLDLKKCNYCLKHEHYSMTHALHTCEVYEV